MLDEKLGVGGARTDFFVRKGEGLTLNFGSARPMIWICTVAQTNQNGKMRR
jgi:hypothetical protein